MRSVLKKKEAKEIFSKKLMLWDSKKNTRKMPWKGQKDPYKIWLSEIILQQTRVEQGLNYYNRFIHAFPTIHDLAKAEDKKILKLWEGLGYYTRCRNLIETSRIISKKYNGIFPETYTELKALKGVGHYTASAIASFAFKQPHAVVDGNVFRVLSRVFGIKEPVDTGKGKKIFTSLAEELLNKKNPGKYNQAIMDFGAVVCKPLSPFCQNCPFKNFCYAHLKKQVAALPVKKKKTTIKSRWFNYLVLTHKNQIIINQRIQKDIWQQLFEFPMIETPFEKKPEAVLRNAENSGWIKNGLYEIVEVSPKFKQQLSHQLIHARFLWIGLKEKSNGTGNWQFVKKEELKHFPFPKLINNYLVQSKFL